MESRFGVLRDSISFGARYVHGLRIMHLSLRNGKHLLVLLGEEAQVEARFGLFRDSANLDARLVHDLHGTYHMLRNQFGCTRWNS